MQFLPVTQRMDQLLAGERNYAQQDRANNGTSFFSLFSSNMDDPYQLNGQSSVKPESFRIEDDYRAFDNRQTSFEPSKEPEIQEPVLDRENFASIKDDLKDAGISKEKIDEWEESLEDDGFVPVVDVLDELRSVKLEEKQDQSQENSDDESKSSKNEDGKTENLDKLIAILEKMVDKNTSDKSDLEALSAELKEDEVQNLDNLLQNLGYNKKEIKELTKNPDQLTSNKEELMSAIQALISQMSSKQENGDKQSLSRQSTLVEQKFDKAQMKEFLNLLEKLGVKEGSLKDFFSKLDAGTKVIELSSKQMKTLQNLLQKGLDSLNSSEKFFSEKQQADLKSILGNLGISEKKVEKIFADSNQKANSGSSKLSDVKNNIFAENSKENISSDKTGKTVDQNINKQDSVRQSSQFNAANNSSNSSENISSDKTGKTVDQNINKQDSVRQSLKFNAANDSSNSSENQKGKENYEGNQEQNKKQFILADSSKQDIKNANSKSTSSSFLSTFQAENSDKLNEFLLKSPGTAKGGSSNLSRQELMRQIENGVFKNLQDGKKQLTLKLDPPDLGRLHVTLQIKDKEVSAVFKTENKDVHRVMNEQVAHLKHGLEQQGLKVTKLEIQANNQNSGAFEHWLGEEGHNQAKERNQNFAKAERQRQWRKFREGTEEQETAQDMLLNKQMDKISSSGLYVVA